MKYVDWINDEYAHGDYSMINAFLLAYDFEDDITAHLNKVGIRKYTTGMRPAKSEEWDKIKLIKYQYDSDKSEINLSLFDG